VAEPVNLEVNKRDALELMADMAYLPDESVDVIVSDPPYWTLDKWRNVGTTTRLGGHRNKGEQRDEMWFPTIDQEYLWQCFLEFDRILKLDGHLYLFCDDKVGTILMNWVQEAQGDHRFGDAHLLVWDKVNQGMGYHYRRRYDFILFAWRTPRDGVRGFKPRKLADLGIPDILTAKRVTNSYPTEKPVEIYRTLVNQSARCRDTLFDPFAGSGTLAAAIPDEGWQNCRVILNDISDGSIAHMRNRFRQSGGLFRSSLPAINWRCDAAEVASG